MRILSCVVLLPDLLVICSSTLHLARTRLHSLTTLAYKSTTHINAIGSTHAIYDGAGCTSTCVYRLFCFPFANLTDLTSQIFFACRRDPPCVISSATHSRRHSFVAGVNLRPSFFLSPNTVCYPPLFVHDGRQIRANRRVRQARARRQQLAA